MSKRKRSGPPTISPWLSANMDNKEGRFIQVGNSLLLSPAFHHLTWGAQQTYLAMAMEAGGKSAFVFPASAAGKYGISPSSLPRYVAQLESAGFITVARYAHAGRKNEFAFSTAWKKSAASGTQKGSSTK